MDAKQFGWIFMFEQQAIGVKISYYGGVDYDKKIWPEFDHYDHRGRGMSKAWEQVVEEIRRVGIDWDKTLEVQSSQASEFQGTFADSSTVATLEGTLVLRDRRRIDCECKASEMVDAFQMMARAAELAEKYADFV